jgi:hypothetical protein
MQQIRANARMTQKFNTRIKVGLWTGEMTEKFNTNDNWPEVDLVSAPVSE